MESTFKSTSPQSIFVQMFSIVNSYEKGRLHFFQCSMLYCTIALRKSVDHLLIHGGKLQSYNTLFSFIWHFVGSPIFGEGHVNGLEWDLCGQRDKRGLENNSFLPFL